MKLKFLLCISVITIAMASCNNDSGSKASGQEDTLGPDHSTQTVPMMDTGSSRITDTSSYERMPQNVDTLNKH